MQICGKYFLTFISMASVFGVANVYAADLGKFGDTEVSLKGYVKLDAILSDFDSGTIAGPNPARDFYFPGSTPVGNEEGSTVFDMHARQTRFGLATKTNLNNSEIKTYIEMDFMVNNHGNEVVSNSYAPRLRHAFLTYNNWLFGQTWSTFMNVAALPDTLDFIGNTDATVFVRQAQIRYTVGAFQFALENPESTVVPVAGTSGVATDDNEVPDLVARYNFDAGNFSMVLAALVRQIQSVDTATDLDATETGYGFSASGVWKIGRNDLKFLINTGSGMGRYIALGFTGDAVLDTDNELNTVDSTTAYVAYRQFWSDKWRSTFSYSQIQVDNDEALMGGGANDGAYSARVNLIYSPFPSLSFGGEVALAEREVLIGASGEMTRLQFSAKLDF